MSTTNNTPTKMDIPSWIRNGRRRAIAFWIALATMIAGGVVMSLVNEVIVLPWQAQTKKDAEKQHNILQTKEKHNHDKTLMEQRVVQIEESDKMRIEQMDKVETNVDTIEDDVKEMKWILRREFGRGRRGP